MATFFLELGLAGIACQAADRTPVVVELFTSEGCSSCPPADQLLADLDRSQPVKGVDLIVLSEHVDYWNRLGWSDPYSSPAFSDRQQQYSAKLHLDEVYTPQAIVDGQLEVVGSSPAKVENAIGQAARQVKLPIVLSATKRNGTIDVRVQWDGVKKLKGRVTVYVALAQSEAESQVRAGENSGHTLKHVAVVRKLTELGTLAANTPFSKDTSLSYGAKWEAGGMRVIVFLQEKASGRIVGAAQQKL